MPCRFSNTFTLRRLACSAEKNTCKRASNSSTHEDKSFCRCKMHGDGKDGLVTSVSTLLRCVK